MTDSTLWRTSEQQPETTGVGARSRAATQTGMEPLRLLVTGSRSWNDQGTVWRALNRIQAQHPGRPVVIVHGACPEGADAHAVAWVHTNVQSDAFVVEEPHPADWFRQGRSAGMRRNVRIVEAGADVCLTFIDPCALPTCPRPKPHGAVHCATTARHAGIPVDHNRGATP